MKTVRLLGMLLVCGLVMEGSAVAAGQATAPSAQEIAANPNLVVAAIKGQSVSNSAAIVLAALNAVSTSKLSEAAKREAYIAIISYAVGASGNAAAPMMGIVIAHVTPAWMPVVAATAVMAAGDRSLAVANAMKDAVAGNAPGGAALRAAISNPSSVLLATERGVIRGITAAPLPQSAPANKPPLPAPFYEGQ